MSEEAAFIAIVGASCQFPGAQDLVRYADLLREGRHAFATVTPATAERVRVRGIDPTRNDWVGVNAVLDDVEAFDIELFGYSRRDAEVMDPQQRVAMRCAYVAMEDAAILPSSVDHAVGVYLACSPSTFLLENLDATNLRQELGSDALALLNHADFIATAVSYRLDLRGPSMGIQTACSGSLVAIHAACEALLSGACDLALAGGVSVRMPQRTGYHAPLGGVASPSGRCRPFSDDADGTVFGSGAGIVVLQRLDDAKAMGSRILGVIRGSAVNNDGRARAGFTAPSPAGQASVVAEAIAAAGLKPADVPYVEAHGTGTRVGDDIELRALADVFARAPRREPLIVGSCKGNIGHADAAAGVAGLLKVLLAFREDHIYPTLGKGMGATAKGILTIPREPVSWPDGVRRAGISSFGIGGTNVHLIVEAAPASVSFATRRDDRPQWLSVSAATAEACARRAWELGRWLDLESQVRLADLAFTLHAGLETHRHRIEVVAGSIQEAATALRAASPVLADRHPSVVFLVPDQDPEVGAMIRDLLEDSPVFAEAFRRASERIAYRPMSSEPLLDAWLGTLAFCLSLRDTLTHFSVEPSVVMGYGLGEVGAGVMVGALSCEEGAALLRHAARGWRDMQAPRSIAVSLSATATGTILPDGVTVTGIDGSSTTVVTGDNEAIECLIAILEELAIPWSPRKWLLPLFPEEAASICVESREASMAWISSLGGKLVEAGGAIPVDYWRGAANRPVDWVDASERLHALATEEEARMIIIDLGPSGRLGATIPHASSIKGKGRRWLLSLLALLHGSGVTVKRDLVHNERNIARRLSLPAYPFDTTSYRPALARDLVPSIDRAVSTRVLTWRREARPTEIPVSSLTARRWLVLSQGSTDALAERLRDMGCTVVVAQAADRCSSSSREHVCVRPHVAEDLADLLRAGEFTDVVHRWSVGEETEDERGLGIVGAIRLMRALSMVPRSGVRRVCFMTQHALAPLGTTPVIALRASLSAFARVAAQEMPHLACHHVDIDDMSLMDALHFEAAWPVVAVRHGHPFTPAYAPLPTPSKTASLLCHGGVYVITGGTGRFGTIVGELLKADHGAIVVALARGSLSGAKAESGRFEVEIADIANRDEVISAFKAVRERHGRIDGVIHAAGSISAELHRSIVELDDEALSREFDARVQGFANVDEACEREGVKLRLLTASMSPILGGLGLAAYAAAHACIDAWADATSTWRAIHWEGWHRKPVAGRGPVLIEGNDQGQRMLSDDEVREQFIAALASGMPRRLLVTRNDLEARLAEWLPVASMACRAGDGAAADESARDALVRIIGSLIGQVPTDDENFFDIGVNSLVVVQLLSHVNTDLDVDVPLRAVFDNPSVSRLAAVIDSLRAVSAVPT